MGKAVCNGITINYRCAGEGTDVVLIHGLATNHAFWHFNIVLPLVRDSHRVTVYDLRGHGYSMMPPSGYTSAHMAEDLHCLLNHLEIPRAHLIGHSLGGVIALHYAAVYPERVASLTIADSRVRALQPTNFARNWPQGEVAIKKLKALGLDIPEDDAEAGLWLLEQLATPQWQQQRDTLKGSSLFIPFGGWNGGQRTAERWLELLNTTTARQDFISPAGLTIEKLSTIKQPTLAIYGENSSTMPSLWGLRDYLPNCETAIVPGAGHFYPFTRPKLFVSMVSQFLKGQGSAQMFAPEG